MGDWGDPGGGIWGSVVKGPKAGTFRATRVSDSAMFMPMYQGKEGKTPLATHVLTRHFTRRANTLFHPSSHISRISMIIRYQASSWYVSSRLFALAGIKPNQSTSDPACSSAKISGSCLCVCLEHRRTLRLAWRGCMTAAVQMLAILDAPNL